MPAGKIVKSVFDTLCNLHNQGFQTWISKACDLAHRYNIDLNEASNQKIDCFKLACMERIKSSFIYEWHISINEGRSTILNTYSPYKFQFDPEKYFDHISNPKHHVALSKLRASSNDLEIERGRYTRSILSADKRLCPVCQVIDNEIHFVTKCCINENLRTEFWNKIQTIDIEFPLLSDENKFCYLMCNGDPRVLSWYGKFVYQSFQIRNEKVYTHE